MKLKIAIDMDDIIIRPHSLIIISNYLGKSEKVKESLSKYKKGKISYESNLKNLYEEFSKISSEDKIKVIKKLLEAIPEDSKEFIEKLKRIGDIILISNNDYDLVKMISENLKVKFLAENKYIFDFKYITGKKSEILKDAGIIPDVVITDDPINESDFLDCATKLKIVIPKREYSVEIPEKYTIAKNLNEVYESIVAL
jgi:phosphoserine phosphatase